MHAAGHGSLMKETPKATVIGTETPDVSHIRNVEVTHETSDVNVRGGLDVCRRSDVADLLSRSACGCCFRFFNAQEGKTRQGTWADGDDETERCCLPNRVSRRRPVSQVILKTVR